MARDPGVVPPQNFLRMPDLAVDPPVGVEVGGHRTTARLRDVQPNPVRSLVWQPVPGLWATVRVMTPEPDQAVRIATQVRFDQARRCIVPFRVAEIRPGTLWQVEHRDPPLPGRPRPAGRTPARPRSRRRRPSGTRPAARTNDLATWD